MNPFRQVGWAWVLLLAALPFASRAQSSAVSTASGSVQGAVQDDVTVFRGLPYAAPPIGNLRWREPQPVEPWPSPRLAVKAAPSCLQKPGLSLANGGDPGVLDEDCLYLNVYTPRADPAAKLPVMVWIHGGALIFGGAGLAIYDGSALSRRGAVIVSINYRLGPLGFFAHPSLEREHAGGYANFGLLDQIAALQWVQRNIEAFGGDPHNVTIFGQSAGAQSVLALIASPLSAGLFQRAIAQSSYGVPSHPREKALETGVAIATAVGLPGGDASMDDLRRVPAAALSSLDGQGLSLAPGFIVGDGAVPVPILQAFQEGREAAVPLIVGSNSDDASVAVSFGVDPAQLVRRLGMARLLLRPFYPGVRGDSELGREVARDAVFTAFARRISYLHSRKAPTWRYYFNHAGFGVAGAGHGAEVPFVLGTAEGCGCLGAPANKSDLEVARRLSDRWLAFARTGTPEGTVSWPPDNRQSGLALEIGAEDVPRRGFMSARLNAFIVGLNILGQRGALARR